MKKFIISSRQIFLTARQTDSHGIGRLNFRFVAFTCTLLSLLIFGSTGVAQAQQPDPLTITKDGNVGVGTTAPKNKLSVEGNADVSGNVGIGTTTPKNKLSVTGNADVSGNVGIGTATPKNKLSVEGNADFNGNVGIGAATPSEKLHVNGAIRVDDASLKYFGGGSLKGFVGPGRNNDYSLVAKENATWLRLGSNKGGIALWANGNAETGDTPQFLLTSEGNVGIGTTTPKAKLEVSGYVNRKELKYGFLRTPFSADDPDGKKEVTGKYNVATDKAIDLAYSIWADRRVAAEEFNAFSDERLKNIQGRSDSAMDLRTLLSLEITDYRHKDVIAKGNGTYKKVTGQQVEKVFPQAVKKHTEVVPDIYQAASIQDGWIVLASNLKKGERVRLISEKGIGVYEVLEVAQDRFRTGFKPEGDKVFVYGREVKDFLTVDYEAISMLNVSATQQIKKEKDVEVKALQEENAALRSQLAEQEKRLSELEARDKARDEKLAAIEAMLLSGNNSATGASSLKKVE